METYCILSQVLLDNICISEYYEHISFFFYHVRAFRGFMRRTWMNMRTWIKV